MPYRPIFCPIQLLTNPFPSITSDASMCTALSCLSSVHSIALCQLFPPVLRFSAPTPCHPSPCLFSLCLRDDIPTILCRSALCLQPALFGIYFSYLCCRNFQIFNALIAEQELAVAVEGGAAEAGHGSAHLTCFGHPGAALGGAAVAAWCTWSQAGTSQQMTCIGVV